MTTKKKVICGIIGGVALIGAYFGIKALKQKAYIESRKLDDLPDDGDFVEEDFTET